MKFTLSWLKDHLDTDEPLDKLADKLTMIGLEVENIEDKAKAARAVHHRARDLGRAASECRPAARLHGRYRRRRAPVQVVCGAPNARAGLISVFSPPGTFIPGKNITLGVGTIRGVESRGMLCSAAELQISEDHDGIMELPADAPVGKGYAEWAGARRSRDRDQSDAEPAGLHRRARHRARSLRRRHGQVQGPRHQADQGRVPVPGEGHGRGRQRCVRALRCGWCAASRTARRRNGCRSG